MQRPVGETNVHFKHCCTQIINLAQGPICQQPTFQGPDKQKWSQTFQLNSQLCPAFRLDPRLISDEIFSENNKIGLDKTNIGQDIFARAMMMPVWLDD